MPVYVHYGGDSDEDDDFCPEDVVGTGPPQAQGPDEQWSQFLFTVPRNTTYWGKGEGQWRWWWHSVLDVWHWGDKLESASASSTDAVVQTSPQTTTADAAVQTDSVAVWHTLLHPSPGLLASDLPQEPVPLLPPPPLGPPPGAKGIAMA